MSIYRKNSAGFSTGYPGLFFFCLSLFLLNAAQTTMAQTASTPMAANANTLVQNTDSRSDSKSESKVDPIAEARKKVAEIEADSEKAESWSNFWAVIGVIAAVAAGVGTFAAYRQASKENQINERLRKADQALAALEMAKANLEIEERKQENLKLAQRLEYERQIRDEYANDLSRRDLNVHEFERDALRQFGGVKIMLQRIEGNEPDIIASTIWHHLWGARWIFVKPTPAYIPFIEDGVVVYGSFNPDERSQVAAAALVAELNRVGVAAKADLGKELPPDTLRLVIGPSQMLPRHLRNEYTRPDAELIDIHAERVRGSPLEREYAEKGIQGRSDEPPRASEPKPSSEPQK